MRGPHVAVLVADARDVDALSPSPVAPYPAALWLRVSLQSARCDDGCVVGARPSGVGPSFEVVSVAPPPQWRQPA